MDDLLVLGLSSIKFTASSSEVCGLAGGVTDDLLILGLSPGKSSAGTEAVGGVSCFQKNGSTVTEAATPIFCDSCW
jgi:hypothetical protein